MIRNVLLDLDETVLDFHWAERIALRKTLIYLGIEPEEKILSRYREINTAQWKLLELGKLTVQEVKVRRYQLLFQELGAECSPQEAARLYESFLGIGHCFIDGAEEMLKALSGHYRLYIASNGTTAAQKSRIASAGIEKYMSGIFLSEEIGHAKPDAAYFEACFARIPEFCKAETVIVGDSLSSDIKGGKNAGIITIWFNPRGEENPSDIAADHEIRKLSELPPLLQRL